MTKLAFIILRNFYFVLNLRINLELYIVLIFDNQIKHSIRNEKMDQSDALYCDNTL